MDVDGAGADALLIAPHRAQQVSARHDRARPVHQRDEQVELLRCQRDGVATPLHGASRAIDFHVPELVEGRTFPTRREAELAVFEYVHCFYNRVRRHSALNYQSPIEYEAKLASKLEDLNVRPTQPSGVGSGGTDLSATPVLKANP